MPEAAMRVFCFPYAGGAAHAFFSWPKKMSAAVEVCLVELPGHGRRISESPHSVLEPLVKATTTALLPALAEKPFVLYGHSMGSLICFEIARQLRRLDASMPVALVLSGGRAPQLRQTSDAHNLPDNEFLEILKKLNGTPQEVFERQELLDMVLPTIRADFAVCGTYEHQVETPLNCPIIAFGGSEDVGVSSEAIVGMSSRERSSRLVHLA